MSSALLGAITFLFTSLGLVVFLIMIAVALTVAARQAGLVGVSGVTTGLGVVWTLLLTQQVISGSALDNMTFWFAVGLIPLAIGLGLVVVAGRRGHAGRSVGGP